MRLIDSLATTPALAGVFSDESVLRAMLDFEAALARAEARIGVIPKEAADTITALAKPGSFDVSALSVAAFRAGTPAIPLVKALTDQVRKTNAEAARFVHWGATSQDVMDSAISLLLKRAEPILIGDLLRLERALADVAERHKKSVMTGRTLLQSAPPVTFGLKVAGWLAPVRRGRRRLQNGFRDAAIVQFGGASGTLASLGDRGVAVMEALSIELGLKAPLRRAVAHPARPTGGVGLCWRSSDWDPWARWRETSFCSCRTKSERQPSPQARAAAGHPPCRINGIRLPARWRWRQRTVCLDWSHPFFQQWCRNTSAALAGSRRSGQWWRRWCN